MSFDPVSYAMGKAAGGGGGGGAKPAYLISDGDTVSTFYFNTGYSLDSFLAGLTYDQTEAISGAGLSFRYLGFGNLSAFDLTNLGMSGEYALAWADASSGSVTPLYTTAPVPAFSISAAGWQVPHFAPGASVLVDISDVYPAFAAIMDSVAAKAAIAFNADAKSVTPDFGSGDMHIAASSGEVWNAVDVAAPAALIPGNVKNGVTIAGVTGSYSGGGGSNEVKSGGFMVVYNGYVESRLTFDHVPSVVIAVGAGTYSPQPCSFYTSIIYSAEFKHIQYIKTTSSLMLSSNTSLQNPSIEITGEGKLRITSSTISTQFSLVELSIYYID